MTNYQFTLKRSPIDLRDLMLCSVYSADIKLPTTYDLRPEMPPIRDQGNQGSCSAQTASEMKEWQERANMGYEKYMSPQFIYNLRENYEEEGMTPRDTMKILNKIGVVYEKNYTYGKIERLDPSSMSLELLNEAARYIISGYARINSVEGLKKALFTNGPCYMAFPVYNPEKWEFWKPDYAGQKALGGHAVSAVGWLKNSFIIRNHWTDQWADNGYTYLKFTDWGMQWEAWTTIDADSLENFNRKAVATYDLPGFFAKLFYKNLHK
jgi:C1A family cysteine protease